MMISRSMHVPPRIITFVVLLLLFTLHANAHPGPGLEIGSDGTLYFADVARKTIWKYNEKSGLEPLVRNRWTHHLQLTNDGTLYYERESPLPGTPPQEFWKITPDGKNVQLIKPESDRSQFNGVGFALAEDGNLYFAHSVRGQDGGWRHIIRKRTPESEVSTIAGSLTSPLYSDGAGTNASFRIITGMTIGPDGMIYVLDKDKIRKITLDGNVTTLASDLLDDSPKDPPHRRGPPTTINRLNGLAVDQHGNVYVAYQAGRCVFRVSKKDPQIKKIYEVKRPWSPIGVAVRGGTVFALEIGDASASAGPRVRKIDEDGKVSAVVTVTGD